MKKRLRKPYVVSQAFFGVQTFITEDIKAIAKEMLVVHSTPDNMPKRARKYVQTSNGKKLALGDSARGSLHNDTYYGAIERDGEIRYVVRRPITSFEKESDIESIVDPAVKEIVGICAKERKRVSHNTLISLSCPSHIVLIFLSYAYKTGLHSLSNRSQTDVQ